jgi:hypothetical protein
VTLLVRRVVGVGVNVELAAAGETFFAASLSWYALSMATEEETDNEVALEVAEVIFALMEDAVEAVDVAAAMDVNSADEVGSLTPPDPLSM